MFRPGVDRIEYGGAICNNEEREAMLRVFDSQQGRRWTIGPESESFEQELAQKTGVKRAVVVNSGSSALLVALTALHLPKGSNVVIPAVNFPTAFNAIIQCGLNPVVVDVDKRTLNLDLAKVDELVKSWKISAVIAVDVAGNPVNLPLLREIVGPEVRIILDNCDGYGTKYLRKFIDWYADVSCVSFHAAHIITMGEGGAVLTDDGELADRARKIREWGRASGTDTLYQYPNFPADYRERYVYEEIGYNLKPLELQCAIGRVQLKKLDQFVEKRAVNFYKLMQVFKHYPEFETVEFLDYSEPTWFSFPFMCRKHPRKQVMRMLEEHNIECRTIFSGNITKHPAYQDTAFSVPLDGGLLPVADDVMYNGVFISTHPSITEDMIGYIDQTLKEICESSIE